MAFRTTICSSVMRWGLTRPGITEWYQGKIRSRGPHPLERGLHLREACLLQGSRKRPALGEGKWGRGARGWGRRLHMLHEDTDSRGEVGILLKWPPRHEGGTPPRFQHPADVAQSLPDVREKHDAKATRHHIEALRGKRQ